MLFRRDILQGIAENRVTLAFRRWRLLGELAGHHAGHDRRALELVNHGEPREAGCDVLDFPRDAREALGLVGVAEQEAIGLGSRSNEEVLITTTFLASIFDCQELRPLGR